MASALVSVVAVISQPAELFSADVCSTVVAVAVVTIAVDSVSIISSLSVGISDDASLTFVTESGAGALAIDWTVFSGGISVVILHGETSIGSLGVSTAFSTSSSLGSPSGVSSAETLLEDTTVCDEEPSGTSLCSTVSGSDDNSVVLAVFSLHSSFDCSSTTAITFLSSEELLVVFVSATGGGVMSSFSKGVSSLNVSSSSFSNATPTVGGKGVTLSIDCCSTSKSSTEDLVISWSPVGDSSDSRLLGGKGSSFCREEVGLLATVEVGVSTGVRTFFGRPRGLPGFLATGRPASFFSNSSNACFAALSAAICAFVLLRRRPLVGISLAG